MMEIVLSLLRVVGVLALVILVFNLIIVVHELGHFLAARWRGLEIEKFQIWFGKPLWRKTINGVQYGLGSIPAGGFVALPQMAPMELLEGKSTQSGAPLKPIKPLDKIIVAFAGPLFSFLLALTIACVVWVVGIPDNTLNSTTIGYVMPDSPAAKAGLMAADEIKSIDGTRPVSWSGMVDSVTWLIVAGRNRTVEMVVERDGKETTIIVEPGVHLDGEPEPVSWFAGIFKRPPTRQIGIGPPLKAQVRELKPNSPAAEAGLQPSDIITAFNGEELLNLVALEEFAHENPGEPVTLSVLRGAQNLELNFVPRAPEKPGSEKEPSFVGIVYGDPNYVQRPPKHPDPITQITDTFQIMYGTIMAVTSKESGVSFRHLNGPLGIMHYYYQFFRSPDGVRLVLWFSVILNINLGLLNLLPLPILDGGHILMALIEGGFRRRINLRVLEVLNGACALALISFMLFISLKDGGDIAEANAPVGEYVPSEFLPPGQRGAP